MDGVQYPGNNNGTPHLEDEKMQYVRAIHDYSGYAFKSYLAEVMAGLVGLMTRWNEQHRASRYLQTLSDQHLSDIGLRRSDVWSSVYGQAKAGRREFEDY